MKVTLVSIDSKKCGCAGKHVPLPSKLFRVEWDSGLDYLCPTGYINLTSFEEEWLLHDGKPPGSVRKHYSQYIQSLFARIAS